MEVYEEGARLIKVLIAKISFSQNFLTDKERKKTKQSVDKRKYKLVESFWGDPSPRVRVGSPSSSRQIERLSPNPLLVKTLSYFTRRKN